MSDEQKKYGKTVTIISYTNSDAIISDGKKHKEGKIGKKDSNSVTWYRLVPSCPCFYLSICNHVNSILALARLDAVY